MQKYISLVEEFWQIKDSISADNNKLLEAKKCIDHIIEGLNHGKISVVSKENGEWVVHEWVKKAILLNFKISSNQIYDGGEVKWYDKISPRFNSSNIAELESLGARIVPGAFIRSGAFIDKNVVIMPSFINIGAHISAGSLIDTWATVGSCAYIGKNCHISGGAGIGGVLEPLQARPVIIEDNCFIGARSEIVEGVIVEEGSVISMGVFIGASTKIVDRISGKVIYGRVPAYSVVVPGNMPNPDPKLPGLYCAVIIKQVDQKTREKTSINELLRE